MAAPKSDFNFLNFGKDASKLGRYGGAAEFLQSPSLRTGASAGLKYFANANPYYAGINAITGGGLDKLLDKGLGLVKKRGPAQDPLATQKSIDWARQSADQFNRMRDIATQSAGDAQRFAEEQKNYRKSVNAILQEGASARQLMPFMAQAASQNARIGQAAQANLAANLSRRGLSASPQASGIEAGAMAGLETGLAAQGGQAMSALQTAALNRALAGQQALFSADVAGRERALARQAAVEQAASSMPMAQQQLELERLKNEQALAMANRQASAQTSAALGQGLVGLYNAYQASRRPQSSPAEQAMLQFIMNNLQNSDVKPNTDLANSGNVPARNAFDWMKTIGGVPTSLEETLESISTDGVNATYAGESFTKVGGRWVKVVK